jgi:hypothetical protein
MSEPQPRSEARRTHAQIVAVVNSTPPPERRRTFGDLLFGRRLAATEEEEHKIGALTGVPVLGLDALSSAAYGPEAALTLLLPLGAIGLAYVVPISAIIIAILLVVYFSYRQTIGAYPNGGGSYTVAKDNLGQPAALLTSGRSTSSRRTVRSASSPPCGRSLSPVLRAPRACPHRSSSCASRRTGSSSRRSSTTSSNSATGTRIATSSSSCPTWSCVAGTTPSCTRTAVRFCADCFGYAAARGSSS